MGARGGEAERVSHCNYQVLSSVQDCHKLSRDGPDKPTYVAMNILSLSPLVCGNPELYKLYILTSVKGEP